MAVGKIFLHLAFGFLILIPNLQAETTLKVEEQLRQHIRVLAQEIGERNLFHPEELQKAAKYIEDFWQGLSYEPTRQTYLVDKIACSNLKVEIPGKMTPEEIILIGAHYDSVYGSPGANDNATGVAVLLELSRLLQSAKMNYTVRWVAFVNEEPPFFKTNQMGSRVYIRKSAEKKEKIKAMLSLETLGYYSDQKGSQQLPPGFQFFYPDTGNFIAVVGNLSSLSLVRKLEKAIRDQGFPAEGLAAPSWIPGVDWSDHAEFWPYGVSAVMLTDTAPYRYPFYHTAEDKPDKIDYPRLAKLTAALSKALELILR